MAREENWQSRGYQTWGPKFRIDYNNPQMGLSGSDVYTLYSVNDDKDVNVLSFSEGGLFKIYNNKTIEIVAGKTNDPGEIDITITSKHGDITITAEKNGQIRIRGKNITIDADENVNINAGKNVNIRSGTRFVVQANQADCRSITGNMAPQNSSFGEKVFGGGNASSRVNPASSYGSDKPPIPAGGAAYLGKDVVQNVFSGEEISKFSTGPSPSLLEQIINTINTDGGNDTGGDCGDSGNKTNQEDDLFSAQNTQLTGNETAGSFAPGGAASGGALAE